MGQRTRQGGPLKEESQTRVDEGLPAWVRFLLVPKSDDDEPPTSLIRQVSASVEDQPAGINRAAGIFRQDHREQARRRPRLRYQRSQARVRPYLLNLEQACELGLINSREYQDAREDLYLTALPVTLERFGFAAQFFAAGQIIREWSGAETPEGHQNNWTIEHERGLRQAILDRGPVAVQFRQHDGGQLHRWQGADQPVDDQPRFHPAVASRRRTCRHPGAAHPGRAELAVPDPNLRPFPQDVLRRHRGRRRRQHHGATFQPTNVIAPPTFSPGAGLGGSGLIPGVTPRPVHITGNPGLQVSPGGSGSD